MKLWVVLLSLVFSAASLSAQQKTYGKEISAKEKVLISSILISPEKYVGKKVLIEGTVVNVCEKRGCWIEIAGDKPYTKMKIKVNDGEIVFPVSEKGKKATVEGEVYAVKLSKADMIKQIKMEAEEHGASADTTKATDSTWYQIKGIGAVIK